MDRAKDVFTQGCINKWAVQVNTPGPVSHRFTPCTASVILGPADCVPGLVDGTCLKM